MEEKILNWFDSSIFNQGEYADQKIKKIDLMSIENMQESKESKELKL